MFGERPIADGKRFARAFASNQIARLSPSLYVRLTGQTGRGDAAAETPQSVADYFERCFDDYLGVLGLDRGTAAAFLAGKTVLEYGPGDVAGVAHLFHAFGAARVVCVDRFAMQRDAGKVAAVLGDLARRLADGPRERLRAAAGAPGGGSDETDATTTRPRAVRYVVSERGLSGLRGEADLVISRAVLEHVDDLPATFADMARALVPGGTAVHQVDLKSHGLHERNPLDFLTWPETLWRMMYSGKGFPNRLRLDAYRRCVEQAGLELVSLAPTLRASPEDVVAVRPHLARPFASLSDEDLAVLGFWLVCRKGG